MAPWRNFFISLAQGAGLSTPRHEMTPGYVNLDNEGRMFKSLHSTLQLEWFRKHLNFLPTHFLPCLARQAIIFIFNEIFWTCHCIALLSRSWEGDGQRYLPKGYCTRMNPIMLWPSDLSWHNGFCTRWPSHQVQWVTHYRLLWFTLFSLLDCTIHPGIGESTRLGQDMESICPGLSIQLLEKKSGGFVKLGL